MRDRSSIAFVTAEEASLDAFLSVSAASPYQQQLQKFTCALRKLAWPPGYAIQSREQQGLAGASADETAPEVPSTLPDLLEVDLGIRGRGAAGKVPSVRDKLVPYASGMTESTGSTSTVDVFSALIADWNQAVVANDPDAIAAFAEPDWVFVGENGIFPGEQFLEAVATGHISHDFMTSEVHDVRVYGDVATVIARVRNRGEFEGNRFTLDEWATDVFVRHGDQWRCSVTHLTSVAATTPAT